MNPKDLLGKYVKLYLEGNHIVMGTVDSIEWLTDPVTGQLTDKCLCLKEPRGNRIYVRYSKIIALSF